MADIGPQFDCVLAWDLGDDLTEADLEATRRWADQIHAADRRMNRPLICRPRTDLRGFSRPANVLLIDRRPLGTSLEFDKYATWVRQQPLLASLGTPIWTTVQTQTNEALRQQLALIEPGYAPPLSVAPEQIRLLAYIAVSSGSRGLVFVSDTPLDAPDPDTRQRADDARTGQPGDATPGALGGGGQLRRHGRSDRPLVAAADRRPAPCGSIAVRREEKRRNRKRTRARKQGERNQRGVAANRPCAAAAALVAFARRAVRAVAVGGKRRDAAGHQRARSLRRLRADAPRRGAASASAACRADCRSRSTSSAWRRRFCWRTTQ